MTLARSRSDRMRPIQRSSHRPAFVLCLILSALVVPARERHRGRGFVLAGETVAFDADLHPQFTEHQLRASADSTRAGMVKWAATLEGRSIIRRFQSDNREVIVSENTDEMTIGRAPQPGFLTLLAASDPKQRKTYLLIVNPLVAEQYAQAKGSKSLDLGLPRTPAEAMALAWAGEMLHVDFYASGIPLPHHNRADFQERWRRVVEALGMPRVEHVTEEPMNGASR